MSEYNGTMWHVTSTVVTLLSSVSAKLVGLPRRRGRIGMHTDLSWVRMALHQELGRRRLLRRSPS
jgi:hypothetical protein